MAKVIAIMNEKGGVGKTATATTLAYLLSQRGHRTALIDFDGQGHSSIIFGVKNTNKLEVTINTIIRRLIEDEPLPEPEFYSNTEAHSFAMEVGYADSKEEFLRMLGIVPESDENDFER